MTTTDLRDEIRRRESQITAEQIRDLRKRARLPSLDGAPEARLLRYLELLPEAHVPPAPQGGQGSSLHDYWNELANKPAPKAWQVWAGSGRSRRLVHTCDDADEAAATARGTSGRITVYSSDLFAGVEPVLTVSKGGKSGVRLERGPWAKPKPPPAELVKLLSRIKALADAPDGAPVRSLGMSSGTAQRLVEYVHRGEAWWGHGLGRWVTCARAKDLRLERQGRELVVRRGAR